MSSSISRSEKSKPRSFIALAITAVLAWIAAAAYSLWGNPELRDFAIGARIKLAYSQQITRQFGHKTIVFGGSSSSFSIDNLYATELGVPIANLGLGAGMGAQVLTRFALLEAQPGDTLIMMMEPELLKGRLEPLHLGQQFAIAIHHSGLAADGLQVDDRNWLAPRVYLSALRPGGFHVALLLEKLFSGQRLYRYNVGQYTTGGQKISDVRFPLIAPEGGIRLSPDSRKFLVNLRDWCAVRRIRLAYALPWAYCPANKISTFQEQNVITLCDIAPIMIVLADARLGAYSEKADFADIAWHLNQKGARIRTAELVHLIRDWKVWTLEDLRTMKP
jgi:hypothetical protein